MAQGQIVIRRKLPSTTNIQDSLIWDEALSAMARFTLIAMLSMRKGWDYSVRGMAAMIHVSKDTMSKYIRELEDAGYLKRVQRNGENGKFCKATYILTDTPWEFGEGEPCPKNYDTEPPCPNLSAPEMSAPENSPQQNIEIKEQKREENNDHPLPPQGDSTTDVQQPRPKRRRAAKSVPSWEPERFEGFWRAYPRDEDRAKAVEQWDKLPRDGELMERYGTEEALLHDIAVGLKRHLDCEDWQEGRGIPYAFRWLRDRRWTEKRKTVGPSPEVRPSRVVESGEVPVW